MNGKKLALTMFVCVAVFAVGSVQADTTLMVDFAAESAAANWNAVAPASTDGVPVTVSNLIDTDGNTTGISVIHVGFHVNANSACTTSPTGDAAIFAGCSNYGLYGNTIEWQGTTNPSATVTLSGLSAGNTYDLVFFASRTGVTDNRETEYAVVGGTSDTVYPNASSNTTQIASVLSMTPDASGEITITVDPGPNNNNDYNYYYLSAMQITETPEPATLSMLALGGLIVGLKKRRRQHS